MTIVEKMFYCEVRESEFIFKQGDNASNYFIVERGQVDIIIDGAVKKQLKAGDAFGELALLYNAPRSASVRATSDSGFWAIDRKTFRKAVEELVAKE